MGDTAAGKYLSPESNPWLKASYDRAAENILPGIDTSAIQSGRYGGSSWALRKGRAEADLAAGIYGPAYEQERARQFGAQQYLTGLGEDITQQERDRQFGAQQYITGLGEQARQGERGYQVGAQQYITGLGEDAFQQERARQFGAQQYATGLGEQARQGERGYQVGAQQFLTGLGEDTYQRERERQVGAQQYLTGLGEQAAQFGLGQRMQAAGMLPGLAQQQQNMAYQNAAALGSVGAQETAYQQSLLNAEKEKYDYNQMAPWQLAQLYAQLISGAGGGTQSQNMYGPSGLQQVAGAGMAGLGTWGMLAANPATAGYAIPIGAGMAGLSLLAGG